MRAFETTENTVYTQDGSKEARGKVLVQVMEGRGLRAMDKNGLADVRVLSFLSNAVNH